MPSRYLNILILLLSLSSPASQAALTPGLDAAYNSAEADAKLPVLIALKTYDARALNDQLLLMRGGIPLPTRHQALMDSLFAHAKSTQLEIENSLAILQKNGMLQNQKQLWIENLIAAEVNRAGAELIANLAAVQEVGLDVNVASVGPVNVVTSESKFLHLESSLREIHAPQAWETGTDGEGTTVALIGLALHDIHPTLDANRRNFTPPVFNAAPSQSDANIALSCMIGLDADKGDTLGLAYRAKWIAAPAAPQRLSDALQLLQWLSDPDQNSATFEDVPAVILHAWEAELGCQSAAPVAVWNALNNSEWLGPISIFVAGEHGMEDRGTIALPAARAGANSPGFCVGNLDMQSGPAIVHAQSSRGPSPCDLRSVKPDLSAPGTAVRAFTKNEVVSASGTLCAASYVAAVCAIMRQANPEITPAAAKIALQLSAKDLGVPGEDNDFGFGLLDAAAAVSNARGSSNTGSVSGTVRYGGTQIADARIFLTSDGGSFVAKSDAIGNFRIPQVPTNRKFALHVTRFGYRDFTRPDSIAVKHRADVSVLAELTPDFADDAEIDRGFAFGVNTDNATSGTWTRSLPVASYQDGKPVQIGEDVTPYGSFCFITGNAASTSDPAGAADVDGGTTTLRSPIFSLASITDPKLSFHYAYSNDLGPQKGGDFFTVQVSNDAGKSWTNLIHTSLSTSGWQNVELNLRDFIVTSDEMIIQFVAEDNAPPSLVEAAVDDIRFEGKSDALEPPTNLQLTPQADGVLLYWNGSRGAASYGVYMSDNTDVVYAPEYFLTTVTDTFAYIPFTQIPYDQPYFQIVAQK